MPKQIIKMILGGGALLLSTTVWSQSYIYLTNNTEQTLNLTIHQRGSVLVKGEHWKQHATTVPPLGTVRYLETNRDTGIKWGKDYYFDTTVTAEDGSTAVLQQKLTGTMTFSDIWHATQQSIWYDDRNIHSVTQDFVGAESTIAFKAEAARANGDDYYYVIQPKQKTPDYGLSNQFNVMAYNVWALSLGLSKSASERLALLGDKIKGYDAIVFSELFDNNIRTSFLASIKSEYPYQTSVVDQSGSIEDGGVLIVSRWPIEISSHHVYTNACDGFDCVAAKGVKYARINKGGNKYHLFGTHTQAFTSAEGIAARAKQFQQMRIFMDNQNISYSEPVIITGDLNVDKEDYPQEYASMLNTLQATEVARSGGHKYTADGDVNNWVDSDPEILDYVLYSDNHIQPTASAARVVVPRSIHASVFTKYDLSDHFAIKADLTYNTPSIDPTIAEKTVAIQNTWGCNSGDDRCNKYLEFSGSDIKVVDHKVIWKLLPAESPGEYYIQPTYGCDSADARCDDWLTFSDSNAKLGATDRVVWRLTPIEGKEDTYHIQNRDDCEFGNSHCDDYLTFSGTSGKIHSTDKVEWRLVKP